MGTLLLPITKKTFEKQTGEWLKIIASGETGTILFFPNTDRLRRIPQLLSDKKLLKRSLKESEKYYFLILDLDLFPIEEHEDMEEFVVSRLNQLKFEKNFAKFSQWVKFLKKEKLQLVLIIANAEKLLTGPFHPIHPILFFLAGLIEQNPCFQALFFFEKDILHSQYFDVLSSRTIFFQNLLYYPLYSEKDVTQFILYLSSKWDKKIPKKLIQEIIKNCGGHFWLVKEAVRYFRQTGKVKNIFDHEAMNFRLEGIYNSLLESEKSVLKKIIFGQRSFNDLEKHSLSHLKKISLVDKKNQLTIRLLERYVKDLRETRANMVLKNGNVLLNNVPVEGLFSRKERRILKRFIENQDKLITRDELAKWIWSTNTQEKYSDWAIDQLITRLRKRLGQLSIPKEAIKTIRGRGYLLSLKK